MTEAMAEQQGRLDLTPSRTELQAIFDGKYRREPELGWSPKLRLSFGYFNPDDQYEAVVAKLVQPGTWWADIGCGRDIFPSNPNLARELAQRSAFVFGIDPDPNIRDNPFISEGFEGTVEDCRTEHRFDLITLRMVAEHIVDPDRAVTSIARLARPGGLIVIYTPNKWAPVSLLAAAVPNRFHQPVKRVVWETQERDTFPTAFRLNTRATIARHCARNGLAEVYFAYLDDCRTTTNFRWLNVLELTLQRALRLVSIRYPENCLLGVYRRT
jgi:SAM-dependent methyltransferase